MQNYFWYSLNLLSQYWTFLYCSLFSYLSSNYCDSWKSNNFRESNHKKKQRTDTINEAKKIKSDNLAMGNREKFNIAIAILKI